MQARDPKGYYAQLGVAHTASAAEIKQAFRRLALHVHPDRNPSAAAEETFKQLIQAHAVLSNPTKRANYDAQCVDIPQPAAGWGKQSRVLTPIVCVVCGRIPIQPKYVIFYEVKSLFVTTRRTPIQGIYCRKCADKRLLRATLVTWLLGWWGLPWGPFYTLHALVHNLLGGRQPSDTNARILGYQARYFASVGRMFLARSLALMALELSTDHGLRASLQPLLPPFGEQLGHRPRSRLKHGWELRGSAFIMQSVLLLCLSSAGMFLFAGGNPIPQSLRNVPLQNHKSAQAPTPAVPEISPAAEHCHTSAEEEKRAVLLTRHRSEGTLPLCQNYQK
jgi:DnaJ domain